MKKLLSLIAVAALLVPTASTVAMQERMRSAGSAAKARMQQMRESAAKNAKKLSEWTGSLMADVGRAIRKQDFKDIPDIIKRHKKKAAAAAIIGAGAVLAGVNLLVRQSGGSVTPEIRKTPSIPVRKVKEKRRVAGQRRAVGKAIPKMKEDIARRQAARTAAATKAAQERAAAAKAMAEQTRAMRSPVGAGFGLVGGSAFEAAIPRTTPRERTGGSSYQEMRE